MDLNRGLCAEAFAPTDIARTLNYVDRIERHTAVPLHAEVG